jgi:hypothetical protein
MEAFLHEGVSCTNKLLKLIHRNIWGPSKTSSFGGTRYFVSFMDDFSQKKFILKNKVKYLSKFKEFKAFVEKQIGED